MKCSVPFRSGFRRGDRVEQEADGKLGHMFACGQWVIVQFAGEARGPFFQSLSRTLKEAGPFPGDKTFFRRPGT